MIHETIIRCLPHTESYFAACNSADGFVSNFPQIFNPVAYRHIYIIKGGPGTGKSRFMNEIAANAELHGHRVRYYYCSSDTASLDAITVPSCGIAVLDGTAPHMTDPVYPGAVEEIINMGQFFNTAALSASRSHIVDCISRQSEQYHAAYHALGAAHTVSKDGKLLSQEALDTEKAMRAILRILRPVPQSAQFQQTERIVSAIGTQGSVHFETFDRLAQKRFVLTKNRFAAQLFLAKLLDALCTLGISYTRLPNPFEPSESEGVFLSDNGWLFVTDAYTEASEEDVALNMERFLNMELLRSRRPQLRAQSKLARQLRCEAETRLRQVAEIHAELESYYIASMNFKAKEAFTAAFLEKLAF